MQMQRWKTKLMTAMHKEMIATVEEIGLDRIHSAAAGARAPLVALVAPE